MLEQILLGMIKVQPQTGYDLKAQMDLSTAFFWHARHSQIYTTLRRLEADGLLHAREDTADRRGRRIYQITAAGEARLAELLAAPPEGLPAIKDDTLVRMFFAAERDPALVLAELRLLHQWHVQRLAQYRKEVRPRLEAARDTCLPAMRPHLDWQERVLRFGEQYEAMYIAWLEAIIDEAGPA